MKRSVLDLYLTKVSKGDSVYLEKLCARLADRLLFVPLLSTDEEGKEITQGPIPFLHIKGGVTRMVPAFTHENGLREWCKLKTLNVSYASLLGSELCAALTRDIGLVINPGSENEVSLASDAIDRITSLGNGPDAVAPLGTPTYQHVHADLPKEILDAHSEDPIEEPLPKEVPVDLTAVTESPVSGTVSISDTVEIPQPEVFQTPEIVAPSVEAPPPSEPSLPEKSYSHGDTQEIHTEEIRIVSVLSSKRPIITLYDVVEEPPSK